MAGELCRESGRVSAMTIGRRIQRGVRERERKKVKEGIVVVVLITVAALQKQGCSPPQDPASAKA